MEEGREEIDEREGGKKKEREGGREGRKGRGRKEKKGHRCRCRCPLRAPAVACSLAPARPELQAPESVSHFTLGAENDANSRGEEREKREEERRTTEGLASWVAALTASSVDSSPSRTIASSRSRSCSSRPSTSRGDSEITLSLARDY
jgi:hypothetical protein